MFDMPDTDLPGRPGRRALIGDRYDGLNERLMLAISRGTGTRAPS